MVAQAQSREGLPMDLTLAFDVAALWPEPEACPDWPYVPASAVPYTNVIRGRAPAVAALEELGRQLNGGRPIRKPTESEAAAFRAQFFVEGNPPNEQWRALGLRLAPRPGAGHMAHQLVAAAHLRGYLRKLDAVEARQAEEAAARRRAEMQRTADNFIAACESGAAEYRDLAEAAARHQQRIDDEKAFHRQHEIKQGLQRGEFEARRAARELGLQLPAMPQLN